jgi:hypothetical protein
MASSFGTFAAELVHCNRGLQTPVILLIPTVVVETLVIFKYVDLAFHGLRRYLKQCFASAHWKKRENFEIELRALCCGKHANI